jgi:hypothetical protein
VAVSSTTDVAYLENYASLGGHSRAGTEAVKTFKPYDRMKEENPEARAAAAKGLG